MIGAIRAYQSGQYDHALFLLSALLSEPSTPDDQRQQALIYLAEVFLAQGNEASARESFEAALGLNPSLQLDPFEHPPDVCAFFEVVRSTWSAPADEAPPPLAPPPARVSPWLPLGIPQISQGRPGPGTVLAVSQGLSCGLSAGMFVWLAFDRRYTVDPTEPGTTDRTVWSLSTLRTRRAVQWTASATCQAAYAVGVVDAALAQRRDRTSADGQAAIELHIGPTALTLSSRF